MTPELTNEMRKLLCNYFMTTELNSWGERLLSDIGKLVDYEVCMSMEEAYQEALRRYAE